MAKHVHVFRKNTRILSGALDELWTFVRNEHEYDSGELLIFDANTGRVIDFDPTETPDRETETSQSTLSKRGRPKLGVVSREVTLLPRHWEWLNNQRGGASATLRRLVDEARKANPDDAMLNARLAACYQFMNAMAGNLAGYEEALRCLYRRDEAGFFEHTKKWPADIRRTARDYAYPDRQGATGPS